MESDEVLLKEWVYTPKPSATEFDAFAVALKMGKLCATLLYNRGIRDFESAKKYFRPDWDEVGDPFSMKDMDRAVERIRTAIANEEGILVYGDYDVDGTTAVALVASYLKRLTGNILTYIPDRNREGYGLSEEGLRFAHEKGMKIVIVLDCGIKAFRQAELAKGLDLDLIICDHHTPAKTLPDAFAVLDPKRGDCQYPYKELSGCGIGFKLCQALHGDDKDKESLSQLLDLVAVSIGADIVPITGENRVLAHFGLKRLNSQPRPAFAAIKESTKKQQFNIGDVVFTIAPRINAAGRMKNGSDAVDLMLSEDTEKTKELLAQLNQHNHERKNLDERIRIEAVNMAKADEKMLHSTVVYDEGWHKGVIGIVASRLVEAFYRPAIVFTKSNGHLTGSARSVEGFNLYEVLEACESELIQFGGHKYAAGMTLQPEKLGDFKAAFDKVVGERITEEQRRPQIRVDAELDLGELDSQLIRRLLLMEPYGPMNDQPVFSSKVAEAESFRTLGNHGEHLKFETKNIHCIAFNMAHCAQALREGKSFEMVYHLEMNEFRGVQTPQIRVLDIHL